MGSAKPAPHETRKDMKHVHHAHAFSHHRLHCATRAPTSRGLMCSSMPHAHGVMQHDRCGRSASRASLNCASG